MVAQLVILGEHGLGNGDERGGVGEEAGASARELTCDVFARAIGWRTVIGYANQPGKADQLTQACADAVTTKLDEITTALRATLRPALPN
jgi:hypothetical protein